MPDTCTCTPPRSWTVDDVAAYLRVHHRTVLRMVERGEIPALRLGKIVRFDPEKVVALFDDAAASDQS